MTGIALQRIGHAEQTALAEPPLAGEAEQYRWLIDHSPLAMCVHVDGRCVYVNPTWVRKIGARSANQLLGRSISDFIHPDSLGAVLQQIASRQHEGDTSPPLEMAIVTLSGATLHVEAWAIRTRWAGRPAHKVVIRDVTEQKATEANLRFQAALVTHVSDAIISTSASGHVTSWNPAAEALYLRPAVQALGMPIGGVVGTELDLASIVAFGGAIHTTHRASDGSVLAVRVSVSRMDGGYVVLCTNQTALRRVEQRCEAVVASLQEGVVVVTADGTIESVNPAALRIFGVRRTGVDLGEIARVADVPVYDPNGRLLTWDQRPLMTTFKQSPRRGCIYGMDRFSDGERIWVSINWSLLDPADPDRSSLLVSIADVTDQHNAHRQLVYQATHDVLTGIPNRARMVALINGTVGSTEYRWGAVLFIDLNKFKVVNDELGHHAGDAVLEIASQRLRAGIGPDDVVGRVGGDEFVVLLAAPVARAEVDALVRRLHAALRKPIRISAVRPCTPANRVRISASIGVVTVRPGEQRCAAEVLRAADAAMYRAKTTGGATCHSGDGAEASARRPKPAWRAARPTRN
ncbi:diguanylate cyclase [Mycobacterium sp.]|uniref:sensor domain-containing protein n=1 Tax=Mycobacterium sp. TaxID=1785 RepID=UPI003D14377C